jgi:hypothetical protein
MSKSNLNSNHESNCCEESYLTSIMRKMRIYHGECNKNFEIIDKKPTNNCIDATKINLEKYNTNTFSKTFAFWKIYFIFFFLIIIGIANVISKKEKSWEYIRENWQNFIYEFMYLFAAFLLSTIFMFFIRVGGKVPIETYYITTSIIFVFCIFKHLAFEFSGIYRFNFGDKECKKENFESTDKKDCECENGTFSGIFWNGLGYQGMIITFILVVFFLISLYDPKLTEKFFNYKFDRFYSYLCLVIIGIVFALGYYIIQGSTKKYKQCNKEDNISTKIINECAFRDKKCSFENDIFTRIKDGCAFVSVLFIGIVTLKLLQIATYHIYGKEFNKEPSVNLNSDNTPKTYNDCYYKSNKLRFILTLVESIIIFLIFAVAEAGIESLRKDHPIVEILSSWYFWEKTLKISFPIILGVQFLLEYSNWFKDHLFNNKDNKNECYVNANKKDNSNSNSNSKNDSNDNNLKKAEVSVST